MCPTCTTYFPVKTRKIIKSPALNSILAHFCDLSVAPISIHLHPSPCYARMAQLDKDRRASRAWRLSPAASGACPADADQHREHRAWRARNWVPTPETENVGHSCRDMWGEVMWDPLVKPWVLNTKPWSTDWMIWGYRHFRKPPHAEWMTLDGSQYVSINLGNSVKSQLVVSR